MIDRKHGDEGIAEVEVEVEVEVENEVGGEQLLDADGG